MNWKVLYTGSRQEKKLAHALKAKGIEVYLPLYKRLSQWSDRKKWVEWPLFSGYLFIRPNELQRDLALQEKAAIAYLRFNGKDAEVTEHEVETIERMIQSGYSIEGFGDPNEFERGDRLMVMDGPLKGQEVEVIRRNKEEIFLVSFEGIAQSIKINLPFQVLKKL